MYDFNNSPPPIVICSTKGTSLPVLLASIAAYVPEQVTVYLATTKPVDTSHMPQRCIALPNTANNFGDAYNAAIDHAIRDGHKSIIVANDDVVLTPESYDAMMIDVRALHADGYNVGIIGSRSDYVMGSQNIRLKAKDDIGLEDCKWQSERHYIYSAPFIAPIFAWIPSEAFIACRFPPINWYSDCVICHDMSSLGYQHFVGRSYVHHVGHQTVGEASNASHAESWPWLIANRPALAKELSKDKANG